MSNLFLVLSTKNISDPVPGTDLGTSLEFKILVHRNKDFHFYQNPNYRWRSPKKLVLKNSDLETIEIVFYNINLITPQLPPGY